MLLNAVLKYVHFTGENNSFVSRELSGFYARFKQLKTAQSFAPFKAFLPPHEKSYELFEHIFPHETFHSGSKSVRSIFVFLKIKEIEILFFSVIFFQNRPTTVRSELIWKFQITIKN